MCKFQLISHCELIDVSQSQHFPTSFSLPRFILAYSRTFPHQSLNLPVLLMFPFPRVRHLHPFLHISTILAVGAEELAQWLKTLAALPEDSSLILKSYMVAHNLLQLLFQESQYLLAPGQYMIHIHIHRQTLIHIR